MKIAACPEYPDRQPIADWLRRHGRRGRSTSYRWRIKHLVQTHRIAGRLYVSRAAAEEFERRANQGEF